MIKRKHFRNIKTNKISYSFPITSIKDYEEIEESKLNLCNSCGDYYVKGFHAISRLDNKTKICSDCGTKEALRDIENLVK